MNASDPIFTPRLASSASRAEQFSVWAIRLWWQGFPQLEAVWPRLAAGFQQCGVPLAIEACHRFCSTVLAAAGSGSGVACLACPRITSGEEYLLAALVVASTGCIDAAETQLRQMMPASAARIAAPHAVRFAQALARAGLEWPASEDSWSEPAPQAGSAGFLTASSRLH